MPRYLILDIDGSHVTLLPVTIVRGSVQAELPRTWDDDQFLQSGVTFRQKLAELKVAPAPIVLAVGRDRLVLKEVKHPTVPLHEEPGIVRFQALKELTDAGDDIVIDYQSRGGTGVEKRALVVALKRSILQSAQTFAAAANLKLTAIVPRAFGIIAAVRTATPPPEPNAAVAAIVIGRNGGEFQVSRDEQLLFSRVIPAPALATDVSLLGEVRRNLAVYNSQSPASPVSAVYVAEGAAPAEAARKLAETLAVPVRALNPLAPLGQPANAAGESVAVAGIGKLLQISAELPINFVNPREPSLPVDPNRRKVLWGAGIAVAVMILLGFIGYMQLSERDRKIANLISEKNDLDEQLARLEPDKRRTKALDDWLASRVSWLDELYDLTARFPDINKIRLIKFTADPIPGTGHTKFVGRVQLEGLTTDDRSLSQLVSELVAEGTFRVEAKTTSRNTLGIERSFPTKFVQRYDVEYRPPSKFTRKLNAEPPAKKSNTSPMDFMNLLGGP